MQHELVFYDLAGDHDLRFSPYCWRTRACLLYKGIPFRAEPAPFTSISVRYNELGLSVHPKTSYPTVPFLIDGERVSFPFLMYQRAPQLRKHSFRKLLTAGI